MGKPQLTIVLGVVLEAIIEDRSVEKVVLYGFVCILTFVLGFLIATDEGSAK